MSRAVPPTLTIVSGPNGAGKSTFTASASVHGHMPVLDLDAIARRMNPLEPERIAAAGREIVRRERAFLERGVGFVVETTLAGVGALRLMSEARARGFTVNLIYIGVNSAETTVDRSAQRVARGGHTVPEGDVRRRYVRSLGHRPDAIVRADRAVLYDNSSDGGPRQIAVIEAGVAVMRVDDPPEWAVLALDLYDRHS